jgi:hypothetical protein
MVNDRFPPNDPIPLFLSGPIEEAEQSRVRKVVSSGVFRKAVFVFAAVAVVFAVVSVGTVILFASVTASEVSTPAPRDDRGPSTPAIQSTARAETLPGTPPAGELLAAFEAGLENKAALENRAAQNRAEVDQPRAVDPPRAEALFNQFQAWAAEEEAQAPARPPQPVQDIRTQVEDVRSPIVHNPPLPKRRPIQFEQTARAHDPSPQNAQSLMRRLGLGN